MAIELHASQISTFKVCPRFYRYRYVENLAPKAESPKLFVGRGVHAGIAAYYTKQCPLDAYDAWLAENVAKIPPDVPVEEKEKLLQEAELGRKLVGAYVKYAQANDYFEPLVINGKPLIEQEFAVPIYAPDLTTALDGVFHVGRFDGIVRDIKGNIRVLEHKTCRQFPKESELRRKEQGGFYVLAASQLFGVPVNGIIYNLIRKQDPNTAKSPVIARVEIGYNEHQLRAFARKLYNAYRRIASEDAYEPCDGQHCSWMCPYGVLCDAEDDGTDVATLREELFTVVPAESLLAGEEAA